MSDRSCVRVRLGGAEVLTFLVLSSALLCANATMADNNWDGDVAGFSPSWSDTRNWFGNTAAPVGGGVDINFNFQNNGPDSSYDYGNFDDFHSIIFNASLSQYMHLNNPLGRGMDLFGSIVNNNNNGGVDFNVDVAFNAADPHIEANNSQLVFNNGNIYLNGNTVHFLSSGGKPIFVNGAIQNGCCAGSSVQLGSSFMDVHFNNSGNSYSGQTSIDAGQLISDSDNVIPDASDLFVGLNGVYNKNGKTETVRSFFGSGTIHMGNSGVLTYGGNVSQTFSGSIDGGAASPLIKNGTGTLELTGASTYSGATTVNAGTLKVNNGSGSATGSGAVTISSGATLSGGGRISGAVTVNGGGTLSPGNSPGILNVGNLALANNSTNIFELAGGGGVAGTDFDQVNVTGTVDLDSSAILKIVLSYTPTIGDTYTIINNDSSDAVTGQFKLDGPGTLLTQGLEFAAAGSQFSINYFGGTGNDVVLIAVPEPSVVALVIASPTLIWIRRRAR